MAEKDLEPIYDEEIAPLMTKIIKICRDNDIPLIASFQLTDGDEDEDGGVLCCTTALVPEWSAKKVKMARMVLREGWIAQSPIQAFTITTKTI
jgi:hypothetical protein